KLEAICFFLLLSLEAAAQAPLYSECQGCWSADSLGNHRVAVRYRGVEGGVAHVIISWRRRDTQPESKRIIVQDSATEARVMNVALRSITRETGDILFEPVSGKGTSYVYYMPYHNEGRSNYPKVVYWRQDTTASAGWMQRVGREAAGDRAAARSYAGGGTGKERGDWPVNTIVTGFQAIDTFNSFYPMEVTATARETAVLVGRYEGAPFLVFPEDRRYPIRMRRDLPFRWIQTGPGRSLEGAADQGEFYAYQLGIYALRPLHEVEVTFRPLVRAGGATIPVSAMTCLNTGGVDYEGKPFVRTVAVPKGDVQPLWCIIHVPVAGAGTYTGTVQVKAGGLSRSIPIRLEVSGKLSVDGGVGHPAKMTRLQWLNSTLAQENTVIAPYTPLEIVGDTLIRFLGRDIRLRSQGFPEQIRTYFTPEMTEMTAQPTDLLAEGIHFHFIRRSDGKDMRLKHAGVTFIQRTPGTVSWTAADVSDSLRMDVEGKLEFDGFLAYTIRVTALRDLDLKDIDMHIPFRPEVARYMMGLGRKGGYRPDSMYRWKWDAAHKNQDGAWIGTVNAGLQFSLRDQHYERPLNTNFYLQKPLVSPASWANGNKGGIDAGIKGRSMLVNSYSGLRQLRKGDTLYYNFNLLITPFHALNTDF